MLSPNSVQPASSLALVKSIGLERHTGLISGQVSLVLLFSKAKTFRSSGAFTSGPDGRKIQSNPTPVVFDSAFSLFLSDLKEAFRGISSPDFPLARNSRLCHSIGLVLGRHPLATATAPLLASVDPKTHSEAWIPCRGSDSCFPPSRVPLLPRGGEL